MRQREVSIAGLLLLMFLGIRYVPQLGSGRTSSPPASEKGVTEKTSKGTEVQKPPSLPPVWEALCKLNPEYGTDEYVYSQLNHKPAAGTEGNFGS